MKVSNEIETMGALERNESCSCCGNNRYSVFSSSNFNHSVRIVQCRYCGFYYANPLPTEDDLARLYSGYNVSTQWNHGSEFFNREITSLVRLLTPKKGRVLEFGCSYGKILDSLQQAGLFVQGVEASPHACQYIKENYCFPIYEGFIEKYIDIALAQRAQFDSIIALNVVEHLLDPYTTLCKLNQILVPGGHVVVIVPDVALSLLIGRIRKNLNMPDPYSIDSKASSRLVAFNITPTGHLSYFSRKTLRLLLTRVGWKIIKQRHAPYVLSGKNPPIRKDLFKPVLFRLVSSLERLGLGPMKLSYSQLAVAMKTY